MPPRRSRVPDGEHLEYVKQALCGDLFLPVTDFQRAERLRSQCYRAARYLRATDPELMKQLRNYTTRIIDTTSLKLTHPDYHADPLEYPYTLILSCISEGGPVGSPYRPNADPIPYAPSPERQAAPPLTLDEDQAISMAKAFAFLKEEPKE